MRTIFARLFLIVASMCALLAPARAGSDSYEYRWFHYRAGEMRIIMDTSVFETPILSHSSKTRDVRGWLVCIDLKSSGPLAERSRVYGPLWSVPGEQSWLSHADGVTFTEEDRQAKADAGFTAFDYEGNIIRIRDGGQRSRLALTATAARWEPDGLFSWTAESQPPGSEDDVQTLSHRYRLVRDDKNGAQLFETLSGKRVDDRWLEQAFDVYRGMKEMGNVHAYITNERDYLLCFVAPFWNRTFDQGAPRKIVDTFEWKGKTYDREKWAFYFKRGSLEPVIFPKAAIAGVIGFDQGPVQALSIGGQLQLLYVTESRVVLVAPDATETATFTPIANPPTASGYDNGILPFNVQHVPEADTLAFFATDAGSTHAALYLWNYRTGQNTVQPLETTELFRKILLGLNGPKKAIPVEEAGAEKAKR